MVVAASAVFSSGVNLWCLQRQTYEPAPQFGPFSTNKSAVAKTKWLQLCWSIRPQSMNMVVSWHLINLDWFVFYFSFVTCSNMPTLSWRLHWTRGKTMGSFKSSGFIPLGTWMCSVNLPTRLRYFKFLSNGQQNHMGFWQVVGWKFLCVGNSQSVIYKVLVSMSIRYKYVNITMKRLCNYI